MADADSIGKSPAFQFYPNEFTADEHVKLMSLQERGLYITLLCHCWSEGTIPSDAYLLGRVVGVPTATVKRLWPAVAPCFQPAAQEGGRLINRRLERERKKQRAFRRRQVDNGKKGGRPPKPEKPPDNPSLSQPGKPAAPIWQSSDLISSDLISSHLSSAEKTAAEEPTNARSKRPIFTSSRFVVFEWQFDDLRRLLGPSFDAFDIHEWFFELSKKADAAALVIPQRDGGKWLQEQTMAEAVRRGLPVAISAAAPVGKTAGNAAAKALFVARGQR